MALTNRTYLHSSSYELRHRAEDSNGNYFHQPPPDNHDIENNFLARCDDWAYNQSAYGYSSPLGGLAWIGDVGFWANRPDSWHYQYRAMDLTRCEHASGVMDSNWSWRQGGHDTRKYIGTVALLRREIITVLTCWYDSAHHDHIHCDDGQGAAGPIRDYETTDTTLVQAACVHLNGAQIAIDGAWGQQTQDAYLDLIVAFNMKCLDPKTNASHARVFLGYISNHCFNDENAGYYQYSC